MRIPLAAVTLAVAGLSATPVNPPASKGEALVTCRPVLRKPAEGSNPHAIVQFPVPWGSQRQVSASKAGAKLNRLDDRVTNLKARADLDELRPLFQKDFDRLKALRANVTIALLNLRNSSLGLDATRYAVSTSLDELASAIEALAVQFEQLDRRAALRVS